jgi:hypothetical protein
MLGTGGSKAVGGIRGAGMRRAEDWLRRVEVIVIAVVAALMALAYVISLVRE